MPGFAETIVITCFGAIALGQPHRLGKVSLSHRPGGPGLVGLMGELLASDTVNVWGIRSTGDRESLR